MFQIQGRLKFVLLIFVLPVLYSALVAVCGCEKCTTVAAARQKWLENFQYIKHTKQSNDSVELFFCENFRLVLLAFRTHSSQRSHPARTVEVRFEARVGIHRHQIGPREHHSSTRHSQSGSVSRWWGGSYRYKARISRQTKSGQGGKIESEKSCEHLLKHK